MAISVKIKNAVREAVQGDIKQVGKWVAAGTAVKAEYANAAAVEAVKAEFLDDVIYPAMGDNALAAVKADLPRKNSTKYKERVAAQPEYADQWEAANRLKRDTKSIGHTYFNRVVYEYGFGEPDAEKKPPRTLQTRTVEELTALSKAHERDEKEGDAQLVKDLDKVLFAYLARQKGKAATK